MTAPGPSFDLQDFLAKAAVNVLHTILALEAEVEPADPAASGLDRVTGCVGLAGETVAGTVYLHLPEEFAQRAAATMMGAATGVTPTDREVNDAAGELCNMIAGALKSMLCDLDAVCSASPPFIIRGSGFVVEALDGFQKSAIHVRCSGQAILVEAHLRFT